MRKWTLTQVTHSRSFHGKPSNSKRLLVSLSHASSLQPTFSRLLRSGSWVGWQSKAKQNYLESAEEKNKGGQDKGHKAQHRKFPMNLGAIFSICLVLFVGSFKSYRLELSMHKRKMPRFSLGPACVCVNIRFLVFAILWWVPDWRCSVWVLSLSWNTS